MYDDYESYLASPEWRRKKFKRKKMDDFKCQRCGEVKNIEVHHLRYPTVLGEEPLEDLVTLCRNCHRFLHDQAANAEQIRHRENEAQNILNNMPFWLIRSVFDVFCYEHCKKTGLSPFDMDTLKQLRSEFCEQYGIDDVYVSVKSAQDYAVLQRNTNIDAMIASGFTLREICEKLEVKEEPVKKRLRRIDKLIELRIKQMAKTQEERQELMKLCKWTETDEASGFTKLPVGGYVMKIVDVTDNERDEYIEIVWDIAEGEYANHYANEEPWRHTKRRYYRESTAPFFKAFLNRLEESNKSFSIEEWQKKCDPRDFVGLTFGGVVQERHYTNNQGEDKTVLELTDKFYAAQDIRNGDFKIPEPRDDRKKIEPAASKQADAYADEIPF